MSIGQTIVIRVKQEHYRLRFFQTELTPNSSPQLLPKGVCVHMKTFKCLNTHTHTHTSYITPSLIIRSSPKDHRITNTSLLKSPPPPSLRPHSVTQSLNKHTHVIITHSLTPFLPPSPPSLTHSLTHSRTYVYTPIPT